MTFLPKWHTKALLFMVLIFGSVQANAVTFTISAPDTGGATQPAVPPIQGFTQSFTPVTYRIDYTESASCGGGTLVMLDDPALFTLADETDTPIDPSKVEVYVRSVGPTAREIRIDNIEVEGIWHLVVDAGTAEDCFGAAPADNSEGSFVVDRTAPDYAITGPFEDEAGLTPLTNPIGQGGGVYYLLTFDISDPDTETYFYTWAQDENPAFEALDPVNNNDDGNWIEIETTAFDIDLELKEKRSANVITLAFTNVSGPDADDIGFKVYTGAASDKAGNITGELSSNTFELDNPGGPLIEISSPSATLTNGSPITYDIDYTYAETITLDTNDITLSTTGDASADISVNVFGSSFARVTLFNFVGEGFLNLSIAAGSAVDAAGDLSSSAGPSDSFEVDIYGPEVVFGNPSPFYSVSGPATIPFEFIDAVSVSLVEGDIVVITTGTAAYTELSLLKTGATGEVQFVGLSGQGTISLSLPAAVAIDQYFQDSVASDESPAIQVGPVPPMSLSVSEPSVSATISGPVSYVVSYLGVETITLNSADITVQASGSALAATIEVSGVGLTRTITLSDISGEGAIAIVVEAGSASDPEGALIGSVSGNAFAVGSNDIDGDLVPDGQEEFIDLTDKNDATDYLDTDQDIVPDFVEKFYDATDELDKSDFKDSDLGTTPDYVELYRFAPASNENNEADDQYDSDNDGLPDYLELLLANSSRVAGVFDANSKDSPIVDGDLNDDADSIVNGLEYYLNELLLRADTNDLDDFDRDGYADYLEVLFGLNPESAQPNNDDDDDGISNRVEAAAGVDLTASDDQDADGIPDYIEYVLDRSRVNIGDSAAIYISDRVAGNPTIDALSDTDSDGMFDLDELALGFNPFFKDGPVFQVAIYQTVNDSRESVCAIDKTAGEVELKVLVSNFQTNISAIDWSNSVTDIFSIATINSKTLKFDPSGFTNGVYQIQVDLERLHNGNSLVSSYSQNLKVSDEPADVSLGLGLDSDLNGLCDSLAPSVDLIAERNSAPIDNNSIFTDFSQSLRSGLLNVFQNAPATLSIDYATVQNFAQVIATSETDTADSAFGNLMPRVHFQVMNISEVGASASITIPFETVDDSSIPAGSTYRLLTATGWQSFDQTNDQIESAPQTCDSSPVFQSGLQTGAFCIRLTIADGGSNDSDGLQNGVVSHLGAPALEGADPVDTPVDPDPSGEGDGESEQANKYADFEPGAKKIVVGEAGSTNVIFLFFTTLLLLNRKFLLKIKKKKLTSLVEEVFSFPKFLSFFMLAVTLLATSANTFAAEQDEQKAKFNPFKKINLPLDKMYFGVALGQSNLDPDFSNLYNALDDKDTGFKFWLNYQFRERLFLEAEYASLGAVVVEGSEAAIATNVFPAQFSEDLSYQYFSTSALYNYPLSYKNLPKTLSVFAKGGLAYANITSDLNIEVKNRLSPTFGAGLQYIIQEKYVARLEYETFNKDSRLLSLGIAMRLGKPDEPEPIVEEVVVSVVEKAVEEVVEEPVEEAIAEETIEPVPSIEEFIEALEPEEPKVNMEELYASLKRDLEPSSIFEKGSASLSDRVMGNLDEIVYFLDGYPKVRIVITGYASEEGHEYLNENLSRLRAHGAKTYLQANGIADDRIVVRARGEHFPRFDENVEDYRIRNRRIEYDFYIPKK
jgi:outer membrane protein OmpA-like peptidoglycan-associated protein/opacity protein-like surface antigen